MVRQIPSVDIAGCCAYALLGAAAIMLVIVMGGC